MTRRQSLRLCLILVCSVFAASLASCRPGPDCDSPEFLVTKVNDTNDGHCTDDDCSLREATQNANYCPGPDVIRLPAGIYTLSISGTDDTSLRGDLDIVDDVIIIGEGNPEIDANGIDRVFDIAAAVDVSMEGLLIRDGMALEGAGIRNNGVLQLTDVGVFRNEATEDGGGIYNLGSLTVDQGLITDNIAATGSGGGIYNEGDLLLTDTIVANNINNGIYNEGASLELVDCTVQGNEGDGINSFRSSPPSVPVTLTDTDIIGNEGFGFYGINAELTITGGLISNNQESGVFNHTSLTMSGSTVSGNISTSDGGGLYLVNIISATIENSNISGNETKGGGGGIYFWGLGGGGAGTLSLTNVTVSGNVAHGNGGGIFNNTNGTLTVDQSQITRNGTITGLGGGIYNEGEAVLTETTVDSNINYGIYNQGASLELVDCTVEGNEGDGINSFKSSSPLVPVTLTNTEIIDNDGDGFNGTNAELTITGGSISNNQGHGVFNMSYLMMSGTTVSGNIMSDKGGGLYLLNIVSATIENSTISDNSTFGDGGGIYYWGVGGSSGVLSLTNVTVSGNSAEGDGGGIIIASNPPSMMELNNVTLSGNRAMGSGQTIYNNGTVNLHNTILDSSGSDNCAGNAAEVVSLGYNISSDSTCLSGGTDDLLSTDPLLEPLADNGGGTQTHALQEDSPAIDSADPASCPGTDQRGVSRPRGDGCDRGAYELIVIELAEPDVAEPIVTLIPIYINFNADDYRIAKGECTILRWQVDNATDVFLEGEKVETLGAQQVCPSKTTTYEMQVSSPEGEQEAKVTIEVTTAPTPPAAPTGLQIANSACVQDYTVTLTWTDQADNESGYRVYRDGILIATLPANSTNYVDTPPAPDSHIYAVEAFNEAGSSAQISATQPEICPT